jgi:hypothetical protein
VSFKTKPIRRLGMVGERLTDWLSDGIAVDLTEADVLADLDAWFLTIPEPRSLQESVP